MKKLLTLAAVSAAAMLTATSCSEKETDEILTPGSDNAVALGIDMGVQATATKAVVEGKKITYVDYDTEARGLGIVVLNAAGTALYAPDNTADYPTGNTTVWFMSDNRGENWKAISALGGSFAAATAKPYFLTENVGRVYAYYPRSASFDGTTESALKVDCSVEETGNIDASIVNNADVIRNTAGTAWVSNTSASGTSKRLIAAPTETDYLYFSGLAEDGTLARYVNNGRNGAPATEDNWNTNTTNPGYQISMQMEHAMTMVSFRVYNDGTMTGENLELTRIELKNTAGGTVLQTSGTPKMALSNGSIDGLNGLTADAVARVISNYILPKQVQAGTAEDATHFIESTGSPRVNGKTVSKKVGMLTYPIATIEEGDLEAELTIGGDIFTARIPAGTWPAGTNTIYTIKASRRALEIISVDVTEWATEDGGEIDI